MNKARLRFSVGFAMTCFWTRSVKLLAAMGSLEIKNAATWAGLVLCLCACAPKAKVPGIAEQDMTMRAAMEAYTAGDCAKSIELFSMLEVTGHPSALNGLGMAQLECGRNVQAIESFKKAVALAPASSALHSNLGTAYFAAGNYKSADSEFETALRADPSNPEAMLGKAAVQLERGNADKALAIMKQLPPNSRQATEAVFDRALILYRLGIYDDAEDALRECLARGAADASVYNALAITLLGRKKYGEALDAINKSISEDPLNGVYYYNRGNIRRGMKEFPQAIKDYGRAIAYNPKFAEAFVNRGDLLYLAKDKNAGCRDLEEACNLGLCDRLDSFKEMGRCLTGMWK